MPGDAESTEPLHAEIAMLRERMAGLERALVQHQQVVKERDLLLKLINTLPDYIYFKDTESRFVVANTAVARVMNATPEQLIGKTDFDFYPREQALPFYTKEQEVIHQGQVLINHEEIVVDHDGTRHWVESSKLPWRDSDGAVIGVVGIGREISDRKRMELELQQSQQLLRLVIDNLPQSIFWKDRDSVFLGCNRQFAHNVGLGSPDEIVGKTNFDLSSAKHARLYQEDDRWVMETNTPKRNIEEPTQKADGTQSWLLTNKIPIQDETGEVVAVLGMYEDISERRRAEQERVVLQEQLIAAQQAALRELSTPLIPLDKGLVVMPLIGSVDSMRVQQVIQTLLEGVVAQHAQVVILDITGVPVVDTQVADGLLRAAQAVKLLGAQIVLTGIRPEVAQTLVGLGADLSAVVTRSSLQSGIAFAMGRR